MTPPRKTVKRADGAPRLAGFPNEPTAAPAVAHIETETVEQIAIKVLIADYEKRKRRKV